MTIKAIKKGEKVVEVYPNKEVRSSKWWPEDKMKFHYYLEYMPP